MRRFRKAAGICIIIFGIGMLLPQRFVIPVEGASSKDYNSKSFWYYPWGKSVTHKGVDIFAKHGTNVVSSTDGWLIYSGQFKYGGNVVIVLGAKWRLHYYAHLDRITASTFAIVKRGQTIGAVGTTGNAQGKPPHLHYSIFSLVPYFHRIDDSIQGWKKMFFLNPIDFIEE